MSIKQLAIYIFFIQAYSAKYTPDWKSLDSRPLPQWYDEAKFGIFIHWGVFSVPSFHSEWFWNYWKLQKIPDVVSYMDKNYPPDFTYADFASQFTVEFFNPREWADILQASGARYVVLTSKHCEGFTNWPSKYSFNWNSNATGPNRDLVGEFSSAIREKTNLKLGLYHCLSEWFNPLYLSDKEANFTTNDFVKFKIMPELYELVSKYKPELLWSDLCEKKGPASYWTSREFLTWLYNESPVKETVVTNDRWCDVCLCKHGGYHTCTDRYNPGTLQKHKWENCMTIDQRSWGYRRNANIEDYLSVHEIITTFASTISCGGNMLMNVGPTKDGIIMPIFEERLRQFGSWLKVNEEAVYGTVPWSHQNDSLTKDVWYTMRQTNNEGTVVYAIVLSWPEHSVLKLFEPLATPVTLVTMLGYQGQFIWIPGTEYQGIYIDVPMISWNKLPTQWAWIFKLTFIDN
ncbi:alpha-L-fucosidase-like [Mytilus trossulus]|uniref:alpha-L-fucosidase-like n=1 Tax=Mytilus trossulus TaxID=6551 RepID=UPI00300563F5